MMILIGTRIPIFYSPIGIRDKECLEMQWCTKTSRVQDSQEQRKEKLMIDDMGLIQ